MLIQLAVPFVDTSADRLSYALDLPDLPALATLRVPEGPTLRLLGASHQVTLDGYSEPDGFSEPNGFSETGRFSETVACLPDRSGSVPATLTRAAAGGRYEFRCAVRRLDQAGLAAWAAAVKTRYANHPRVLIGEFPGAPEALTVIGAWPHPRGVRWQTWHAYPTSGELIGTASVLDIRPAAGGGA